MFRAKLREKFALKNPNLFLSFFLSRRPITAGTITANKNLSFSPFIATPTSLRADVCRVVHKASVLDAIRGNPPLEGFELIPSSSSVTNEAARRAIDDAFVQLLYFVHENALVLQNRALELIRVAKKFGRFRQWC